MAIFLPRVASRLIYSIPAIRNYSASSSWSIYKGKLGSCTQVTVYGSLSVITTLEFFEHHFAKVGHRLAPYDPTLFLHPDCRHLARESVCRNAASFKSASGRLPLFSSKSVCGPRGRDAEGPSDYIRIASSSEVIGLFLAHRDNPATGGRAATGQ